MDAASASKNSAAGTADRLPLYGIRVLELAHIVAGPTAGLLFADLGADVIKIEEPRRGDQARAMTNRGSTFYALNRNKSSLAIDLKHPEGREAFRRLVLTADVVLDNLGPGVLGRLGLDYAWGSAQNPRIVYASIKGFLPGPYGSRPMLDELAQMMGGMAYMTGPVGQPMRAGASVIDMGAATYAVVATLAALFDRERTGRGQSVESGLFETTVFFGGPQITGAAISGEVPQPFPARGMGSALGWGVYQLFETADDRSVFIAVVSDAHWRRFCQEFRLDELLADEQLATNALRTRNRTKFIPTIVALAKSTTADDLTARLEQAEVPFAIVNNPLDVLSDPHLLARKQLQHVEMEDGSPVLVPATPIASDSFEVTVRRQPPSLGGQTVELLRELGYSQADIDRLISGGVVVADGPVLHRSTARTGRTEGTR